MGYFAAFACFLVFKLQIGMLFLDYSLHVHGQIVTIAPSPGEQCRARRAMFGFSAEQRWGLTLHSTEKGLPSWGVHLFLFWILAQWYLTEDQRVLGH